MFARKIAPFIVAVLLAFGAGAAAATISTTNSGAFNVQRTNTVLHQDGSCDLTLDYSNAATGARIAVRTLYIPANSNSPIVDQNGNVVSATVPSGLASAISTFATQLDTAITNGAGAGKLNL